MNIALALDIFTVGWILFVIWFVVEETLAIVSKTPHTNTLSAHLWVWFSMQGKGRFWLLRRLFMILTLVWLFVHLTLHWSRVFGWFHSSFWNKY